MEIKFPTLQMKLCCIITPLPLPLPPPPLMCPPFGLAQHFKHACMCGLIIFCSLYHSPVVFLRFPPFPMLVKKPTSLKNPKLMWSTQTLTGQFKGRTIRKVMGGEGNFRPAGIFFRYQIPCMNFFQALA